MATSQSEASEQSKLMQTRSPTDTLRPLLDAAGREVFDKANSVPALPSTNIGHPGNSAEIMQEVVTGYLSKVKKDLHKDTCVLMMR
jgi:hypothetical protein